MWRQSHIADVCDDLGFVRLPDDSKRSEIFAFLSIPIELSEFEFEYP
jgi:hypothetical protein